MAEAKFSFFKLFVRDLEASRSFYEQALDFAQVGFVDTPDFREAIMSQAGTDVTMMLLAWKDGRDISGALGHGPTGFMTSDIEGMHARLVAHGARAKSGVISVEGGIRIALLDDPEGHEIELCQMP